MQYLVCNIFRHVKYRKERPSPSASAAKWRRSVAAACRCLTDQKHICMRPHQDKRGTPMNIYYICTVSHQIYAHVWIPSPFIMWNSRPSHGHLMICKTSPGASIPAATADRWNHNRFISLCFLPEKEGVLGDIQDHQNHFPWIENVLLTKQPIFCPRYNSFLYSSILHFLTLKPWVH